MPYRPTASRIIPPTSCIEYRAAVGEVDVRKFVIF